MPTELPSGAVNDWLSEYESSERAHPVHLVHSQEEVPPVDFTDAIKRSNAQILIVQDDAIRDRLRALLPDIVHIAWNDAAPDINLDSLLIREGRQAFVWLASEALATTLAAHLHNDGYKAAVVAWQTREDVDQLLRGSGDDVKAYVRNNRTQYEPPKPPPMVIPDILPPDEPEPVSEIEPDPEEPDPFTVPQEAPDPRVIKDEKAVRLEAAKAELLLREAAEVMPLAQIPRLKMDDWMQLGLHISGGKPTPNVSNVSLLFDACRPGEIWYDDFLCAIMTLDKLGKPRRWSNQDDIQATIQVQRHFGIHGASKSVVSDAVVDFAMRNHKNCLTEFVAKCGKKWDGVHRIDEAFRILFGCKDDEYSRTVSRNFFKSMVARAIWPGCKVDTMVVLEGAQGIGKSTVLEKLGGEYYAIMREAPDKKDFELALQGKWMIEIAELHAFSRADVKSVKRTISTATDRYRPPYAKHTEDHPRQSVFGGTTNRDDWNTDPTGGRRFWPIACKVANPEIAQALREQWFGEAHHALLQPGGYNWWSFGSVSERVVEEQESRYIEDDWSETLSVFLDNQTGWVSASSLYDELGIHENQRDRDMQVRLTDIMRRQGWRSKSVYVPALGKTARRWMRKADYDALTAQEE